MKKIITVICISLCVVRVYSQITITLADMPNAGDSVLISTATVTGTTYTITGANQTWDYSSLTSQSQRYEKFDSPFTFPSIYALLFNALNTTYGKENRQLTSLPIPGISFDAAYDFYKKTSSQLKIVGSGYIINGTPLPFLYTSADIVYNFPLNYGNQDSANYQFSLQIPTIATLREKGKRVNVVEGWGTIITPYGSFQALKVKSIITSTDSIYINTLGFGTNTPARTRIEYKWIANGQKIPILTLNGNKVGNTIVITGAEYRDFASTDVNELSNNENSIMLFPNPMSDNSQLFYNNTTTATVRISVKDLLGKEVAELHNGNLPSGIQVFSINSKELKLSTGVYFINVDGQSKHEVIKFVVNEN
jgi:hypothetical protein